MKKGFAPVILVAVLALVIAVGGVGIGLAWRTNRLDKWLPPNIKEMFGRGEKPGEEAEKEPEEEPPESTKTSELKPLDETWNLYTNYQLGFSIKVPKKMSAFYGSCEWKTDSYRPKEALVPVKIFEDTENNLVYITGEYYHELAGETVKGGVHYYSKCNKVSNSLERVNEEYLSTKRGYYQQAWKIFVKDIRDDAKLEEFIKERYGWGCGLGEKKPAEQEGVYDVEIVVPETADLEEALEKGCLINYMTVLRYYPAKNKAISWDMGQAYTFYETLGAAGDVYDGEMLGSLEFLE